MIREDEFQTLPMQSIGLIRINTDQYEYFHGKKTYGNNLTYENKTYHCFKGKVLLNYVYDKKRYYVKKGIPDREYFGFTPRFFESVKHDMKNLKGHILFLAKLTGNGKDRDFATYKILNRNDKETLQQIQKYFEREDKVGFDMLSKMLKNGNGFIGDVFKDV